MMEPLEKIKKIFEKYTTDYHFYLKILWEEGPGAEYEFGRKKRYPICSCFKLAVLMAFFDSLKSEEELEEEVVIAPEKFSTGFGIMNFFNTSVKFSKYQLAQMMISFSDGTATDYLVDLVGMDKVNEYLVRFAGESRITRNLHEMVTDYNFALKSLMEGGRDKFSANEAAFGKILGNSDFTNGKDLAELALGTYQFCQGHRFAKKMSEIFLGRRVSPLRTSTYLPEHIQFLGKTGSIGFGQYMNDCGVIIINQKVAGYFGYASSGWRQAKDFEEAILGVLGINMARVFEPGLVPNLSYSEETEKLICDF